MAQPRGTLPNTILAVAAIAFALGIVFSAGVALIALSWPSAWFQPGFFVAAWALFHFGEFAVTAGWNRDKLSVDSFLLNNGVEYHVAHSVAILEWLAIYYFAPQWKANYYVSAIGIFVTGVGQVLRSLAMVHASTNFSHQVAWRKTDTHHLVTDGIYAWSRHPSYAGFFYWGLGTQLALQNPVSFIVYFVVLWRFFNSRIKGEERYLVKFFGDDYVAYRKRVGTKLPFIR
ncbi:protein-s-isoprenylcysteine O-methyltransferase [Exidia glandulosa HHB12029]|uniref:Protein-S-isoprenylcysteine O-methyltransferase n=1 Tax=Exidia glandulosa HHB12029 TaxID=1314781 RepID=A0A165QTU1_EXIGL|nr:protein-s-isoprenylcysteine O-methyltransferase [Exidia glandulosa HHB12029]